MHYFLLIYFNNKPVRVSSRLAAHHQEDQLCIWDMTCVMLTSCWQPINITHDINQLLFNSNKSPTRCDSFTVYYPDVYLQLNMSRAFPRPSSGAQWLQWQPLVLPLYRGDSSAVFVVGAIVIYLWFIWIVRWCTDLQTSDQLLFIHSWSSWWWAVSLLETC